MKKTKLPFLSVVVPLFNESKRLYNADKIIDFFNRSKLNYQIIFVNDGSTDNTLKKLSQYKKNHRIKIITYSQNQGKGYALKQGILSSSGKYILFTDIDTSTPLEEFNKFKQFLNNYQVVIGSRKRKGAVLEERQPLIREILGKCYTQLSRSILGLNISDFTCGFKCFSNQSAKDIFSRVQNNRWGFDPETLFIAKKMKYKIKEVPVHWRNDIQTRVKFPQDIIRSLLELIQIQLNNLQRKYD